MNSSVGLRSAGTSSLDESSRQIIAELADGFASFDADWRFIECNKTAERLFRLKRRVLLGRQFCDVAALTWESPFAALVRRVAEKKTPEDAELTFHIGGRSRLLAVRAFPLGDGVGARWRDITTARAAERRLALSNARYHEIADGLPAAAWLSRENGELEFINQAMVEALGRPRRALLGDGWLDSIDPADRRKLLRLRAQARASHSSFRCEGRFRRPDGALRIIELYGRPRFDALGEFRGHIGIATDITDTREAQERQQLLIDELNHRVKNTLAIVQAVVRQTLREHDVTQQVERDVTDRLMAISAAHDLLTRERWTGADLGDVVGEVMRPYDHAGRVSVSGAKVRISPKTAIALSMGLQELATNAAKYGALSVVEGRVALNWNKDEDAVTLEWRESRGPRVTAPDPPGFGSRLLGQVMAAQLGHPAQVVYATEGLICRFRAPVQRASRRASLRRLSPRPAAIARQ
jgi:PAS domain S-box-containing protein